MERMDFEQRATHELESSETSKTPTTRNANAANINKNAEKLKATRERTPNQTKSHATHELKSKHRTTAADKLKSKHKRTKQSTRKTNAANVDT